MKIQGLEVGKIREIIVEGHQIIMREVDPLEHVPVVHDAFYDSRELFQLPDLVVAEHDRAADKLDVDCLFLLLLKFLLCFGGDVFHGACVDQSTDYGVDVIMGK